MAVRIREVSAISRCPLVHVHVHKQFIKHIETVTYQGQTSRSKVNMPNQDTSLLRTVFLSPFTVLIRQVFLYYFFTIEIST